MIGEQKYVVLFNWIRDKIDSGELLPGERLYSEHELCTMFDMSRQTVRHAIKVLEQEGLVERVRGSGTYVEGRRRKTSRKTMNIAVISTYVDSYIFPLTLQGIVQTLAAGGYTTQISFTSNRVENERRILEGFLEKDNVDGVIVEATKGALPNPNMEYFQEIRRRNIPLLFFNCKYPELKFPLVALDDEKAAYTAVSYLLEQGHRKIGGIFKSDDGQGKLRYAGFQRALMDAGMRADDKHVLWIDTEDLKRMGNIREAVLRRFLGCTAAFCYNDQVAFGVMDILKKEGIKIPDQFSITSVDASELSLLSEPQITSVPHPLKELGEKAAEQMLKLIKKPEYDANYLYCPELLVRGSVRQLGENNKNSK